MWRQVKIYINILSPSIFKAIIPLKYLVLSYLVISYKGQTVDGLGDFTRVENEG
jgi:hypothetical protein